MSNDPESQANPKRGVGGMAKIEDFVSEIESARDRAEELRSAAGESRLRDDDLLMDAIEQLQTTIEELRVAEEELRQQNEELLASRSELELQHQRYRDFFEFAPDGYLVTDKDGKILEANLASTRRLGLDQRFLLNKPLVSFIAETDRHTLRNKLNHLSQSASGRVEELSIRISPRTGKPYDAELRVAVSPADKGNPTRLRWLVRDITGRKRVEEQIRALNVELEERVQRRTAELERANALKDELLEREQRARAEAEKASRVKDEFLAICSHELRAPLSATQGWAEMLSRGGLDQATTQRAFETILRNIRAQTQIVGDLLDASRVIAGKLQLQPTAVDLVSVIEAATEVVRADAQAKGVTLNSTLNSEVGLVFGDAGRLQQIVWNLLSNAVKFTPTGGRVTVQLTGKDGRATIVVQDTGIGIKPEFLPHVFELFRQADSSTTRSFGGLGLGLAIVSHLTKSHGGEVTVESEGEGRGTAFTVSLPLMKASAKLQRSEDVSVERGPVVEGATSLEGLRVLLVDDDQDSRGMLKTALSAYGAELKACSSTTEALETLKEWRPDVIVSDIGMPDEDGYDLIHKVRDLSAEGGGTIPALALTGYASLEDKKRSLDAGYQTHMSKPVEIAKLVSTVANLCRPGG
jgi:PAS domain S-box-containing protein